MCMTDESESVDTVGDMGGDAQSTVPLTPQMLESMTHQDTPVTRLVLLGDIFDFWLIPIDQTPMPLEQVVSSSNLYGFNLTRMTETVRGGTRFFGGEDGVFVGVWS